MKKIKLILFTMIVGLLNSCGPASQSSRPLTGVYSNHSMRYSKTQPTKVVESRRLLVNNPVAISSGDLGSGRIKAQKATLTRKPISSGDMGSGRVRAIKGKHQ